MSNSRQTGLQRRLSLTLSGVALISVLLLSSVNYFFARQLILDSVEGQITSVRDTRIQALDVGMERFQSRVATLAANPSVVRALADLSEEYAELDDEITPEQVDQLAAIYDTELLPPFVEAGVDITATDLLPGSVAGRYLQHHYIAENPDGFDMREGLDDAGDGSGYSEAHAFHHPLLRAQLENISMSDLLLVDVETLDVVYSTKKRADLGTDVRDGPYAESGLGTVIDRLSSVAVGDTVVSDSWFYLPTRGVPVFFLAAAVRSGREVIGVVVAEVPAEVLTQVMTARKDWGLLGLGETGESYIVGEDRTLRSDSRAWLEDPDEYLRRHFEEYEDQDATDLIETVGSPVLIQEVNNEAVTSSLEGEEFIGTVTSYLGSKTLTASGPTAAGGLNWVVVVEQDKSETDSELDALLRSMLVVLAVLLPAIALIGAFIAGRLARPIELLVGAAGRIAGGDLDTKVDDLGRNELGDLGRQLEGVAHQLEEREQEIVDEEDHINELLSAVLPARLIDRVREGEQVIEDIFDTATIVSLTVDGLPEASGADQDVVLEVAARLSDDADELMARFDVEDIRRSSGSWVFDTGLGQDDARTTDAAMFALAMVESVAEISAEYGLGLSVRIGMSAGEVATGVLGTNQLSFSVWGDPPGTAVTLGSLAQPGQILVDANVVEQLGPDWDVDSIEELPGLADDLDAYVLHGQLSVPAAGGPSTESD